MLQAKIFSFVEPNKECRRNITIITTITTTTMRMGGIRTPLLSRRCGNFRQNHTTNTIKNHITNITITNSTTNERKNITTNSTTSSMNITSTINTTAITGTITKEKEAAKN